MLVDEVFRLLPYSLLYLYMFAYVVRACVRVCRCRQILNPFDTSSPVRMGSSLRFFASLLLLVSAFQLDLDVSYFQFSHSLFSLLPCAILFFFSDGRLLNFSTFFHITFRLLRGLL
uniref:Putative secreted peptide n=1 Tax=Anopheles braziliensis TaxID=58242 RepID=A0A2M3ZX41_9DIPT